MDNQKRTLALMLNVDWFQPFKHCTDSVGAGHCEPPKEGEIQTGECNLSWPHTITGDGTFQLEYVPVSTGK